MSGWYYRKTGTFEDTNEGPLSDQQLLHLAFEGKIGAKTHVVHPTHTRQNWVLLEQIPAAKQKLEEGERQRAAAKEQQKQAAEAERQRAIQEAAERRAASPITALIADGQSEAVVSRLYDRVQQILTPDERIEYIAVQAKPIAIAPDCVVLTNRRLIVYKAGILGQSQFQDYLWMYLQDARIKEGVMFSELSFRATNGAGVSIDYLPKAQGRRIYRIAQQREEEMIEFRRQRQMEETRAGASSVVVQVPGAPSAGPSPNGEQSVQSGGSDPVARLAKLKQMLDQGLIERGEYEAAKARILSEV